MIADMLDILSSIKLFVIIGGAMIADKFGRRVIVLGASSLCFVSLIVLGALGLVHLNNAVGAVLVRDLAASIV
jgi:hypothetical protein